MICYQKKINLPTEPLTAKTLLELTKDAANCSAINSFRRASQTMAEAEAQGRTQQFVAAAIQSDKYLTWLAAELKKDERRKAKLPADDLHRIKLFIKQMKGDLPAFIPKANFVESTDRWGRTAQWRVQAYGYLTGLAELDGDHVPDVEARVQAWLQRPDFDTLGILWIFITPSGEGVKVVFKAREEWGNLIDNTYQMGEILGILDYADSQCKNSDHAHFIPRYEDIKYIDWEELFSYENPDYEARYGAAYRRGESEPTQARWQELERERKAQRRKAETDTSETEATAAKPAADTPKQPIQFTERDEAIIKVLNDYYGESLPSGQRHPRFTEETSHWTCWLCDNDPEKAIAMSYRLDYVKDWKPNPGEVEDLCRTAAKKKLLTRCPKQLSELVRKADASIDGAKPDATLPTAEWVEKIRSFFGIYPCMREVCEWAQKRLWPFLIFATAGLAGTLMTLCWWFSYDNPLKKRRLNYNVLGIGDPAVGKGPLEDLCELWTEPIAQSDKLVNDTMNEWKEEMRTKSSNADKTPKPKGVVRIHGARTSNNVFINDMMNAWGEVEGERMQLHMLTVDSEALNSIKMAKGGSWIDRSVMEIKSWSNERDSQQYANLDSMTGAFNVFWNQVRTCTPPALKVLANERNFGSGWPLRVSAIPVPDNDFDMIPLRTRDEKSACLDNATIREWAYRLDKRQGELPLWPLVEHCWHWTNDHMEIAKFNEDKADRMLLKRIAQTTLCIAAPWVDMRHWEEREKTGTYEVDDTDIELLDLLLDIQYKTQRHFFYELADKYYDDQRNDAATFRRRTTRFEMCYQRLPEEFTTAQFVSVFGYANAQSASKTIDRLLKDKMIERKKRGAYRKRVQNLS